MDKSQNIMLSKRTWVQKKKKNNKTVRFHLKEILEQAKLNSCDRNRSVVALHRRSGEAEGNF